MIAIALLGAALVFYLVFVMPLLVRFLDRVFFPYEIRAWSWYQAWMLYFRDITEDAHE